MAFVITRSYNRIPTPAANAPHPVADRQVVRMELVGTNWSVIFSDDEADPARDQGLYSSDLDALAPVVAVGRDIKWIQLGD